jgi:quercetin dioxygenase-like cupin family protein
MDFRVFDQDDGVLFQDNDIAVRSVSNVVDLIRTEGTFFFVVTEGTPSINGYWLRPGMYGSVPRAFSCLGHGFKIMLVEARAYAGLFSIGGPVETAGRLKYIDGCTDTGLIQPPKQGDPCLNALFFPPGIAQSPHTHPSHRVGTVHSGHGLCITPDKTVEMKHHDIWIIPKNTVHHFVTERDGMRVAVFHPDSEIGPTDERHQMLEATVIA